MPANAAPHVSVIILTHNEERNLPPCLDSLSKFADIHVLDSGSSDPTTAIAVGRGVPVHANPFQGFGRQRNWAIDNIPTKHAWQFHLDADERMSPELAAELAHVVAADPPHGGFRVPSKLMFAGRWLKYAGQYPAYQVRLFHRDRLRFLDYGHGQREITTFPIGTLVEPLIHFGFSKGVDDWFIKHVRYARREADQAFQSNGSVGVRSLFSRDATTRRRALKHLTLKLPGRYVLRLAYMLICRRAILDGRAGVTYSHMIAVYEGMIDVYLRLLGRGVDPDSLSTHS
jgi:glycosyltransferase involved in cell wall biosynthesis